MWALAGFLTVTLAIWLFVVRMTRPGMTLSRAYGGDHPLSTGSVHTRDTLEQESL
jgi:hypothetical protein